MSEQIRTAVVTPAHNMCMGGSIDLFQSFKDWIRTPSAIQTATEDTIMKDAFLSARAKSLKIEEDLF